MLPGPLDDVIQVDELDAIGIHMVLELCSCDTQLGHTPFFFFGKIPYYSSIMPQFKAADYAQYYAGIIFSSLTSEYSATRPISSCDSF